jgi:hypothetical protein
MSAFHTHNGWHWRRTMDGSVVIQRRNNVGNVMETHTLPAAEWASLLGHLCLRGSNGETVQEALDFHMKFQA